MNKEITHTCDTSRLSQARDSMCHACRKFEHCSTLSNQKCATKFKIPVTLRRTGTHEKNVSVLVI